MGEIMKLLKIFLGAALVAGQWDDNWQQATGPYGGRQQNGQQNGFINNENEWEGAQNQGRGNQGGLNTEFTRGPGQNRGPNQGQGRGPNQGQGRGPNQGQGRGPNNRPTDEFEVARQGQCSTQDFNRQLQTACERFQNGAAAAQAVQPAAYFHFSTGTAGNESRDRPVRFENADFLAGFRHNNGRFTVPHDGVYEFGVSLRLDRRRDAPLYMYIRVNNEDKIKCVAISDMSNCHGMIKAQRGDEVFVRTERNGHYGNNRDSHLYSFFEGRLVHLDAPTGSPRGAVNTEVPRQGGRRQEPQEPAYSVERPRGNQNQWGRGRP